MDTLLQLIRDLVPLWWLIAVLVVFFAVRFYYKRFVSLENKVKKADCEKHHERILHIDSIRSDIGELKSDITTIKNALILQGGGSIASVFSAKNSPRVLTPIGIQLYKESGAKVVLGSNLETFISLLEKKAPKTALDVENEALFLMYEMIDESFFSPLKDFVYNSPSLSLENGEKRDISLCDICFVMSIPLRDAYLQRHSL